MSQPESHPTQKVNLSGLSIEVNNFFFCTKKYKKKGTGPFFKELSLLVIILRKYWGCLSSFEKGAFPLFFLAADSVSTFILGAVESLISSLDDLMSVGILLIALRNAYTDSHSGSPSGFLVSFRAFLLFGTAVRSPQEKA